MRLLYISKDLFRKLHSRFLRPVALVVDSCGDADHNGREEVTRHVVVLFPWVFALKDLDEHEVQLDPLKTHPGEGSQEEEVEDTSDDGASDLGFRQSKKYSRKRKHKQHDHIYHKMASFIRFTSGTEII